MQLYKWGHQKPKWKDLKTYNVETQIQTDENGVGANENIGLGWSQGFVLDELNVWQEHY
jgi:hypothetical protein